MMQLEEIDDGAFDEIATEAAQTVKAAPRLGRQLAPVVAELDAALPRHIEVGDDVRSELDRYERDSAVRERIGAEVQTLFAAARRSTVAGPPVVRAGSVRAGSEPPAARVRA
jgi:hypothetical protein